MEPLATRDEVTADQAARAGDRPPTEAGVAALNAALVLLMDHEPAASTVAARITAGTGADPWLVLLTGLAALDGPRHGRSSVLAEDLLGSVRRSGVGCLDRYATQLGAVGLPRFGLSPNVDLGLAALVHAGGLRPGSGETVFALSRRGGKDGAESTPYLPPLQSTDMVGSRLGPRPGQR